MRSLCLIWLLLVLVNCFVVYAPSIEDEITYPNSQVDLPSDFRGTARFPDGGRVTHQGRTYALQAGGAVTVNEDGSTELEGASEVTTETGTRARNVPRATVRPEQEHYEEAERIERPAEELVLEEVRNADVAAPGGDMQAERAARAKIGEVVAFDAEGVSKRNGILRIAKASRIEIRDGILTHVVQFQGSGIQFHVGAARDVLNGCVLLKDVWDSDFTVTDRELKIEPGKGVAFNIADCRFSQSTFTAFSDKSKVVISKTRNRRYEITEGKLECHSAGGKETIEARNAARIDYGSDCFSCLLIEPEGTYWHSSEELNRDFGLHVPNGTEYKLCLRKQPLDYFPKFDGLVDFTTQEMQLSGLIEYLRYPTVNGTPASLLMMPVYKGLQGGTTARFSFDESLDRVSSLTVGNDEPKEGMLSWMSNGHYAVYELHQANETKRFGRFLSELHPSVVQRYSSAFGKGAVSFSENALLQEEGSTGTRAWCDTCRDKKELESLVASQLDFAQQRCVVP